MIGTEARHRLHNRARFPDGPSVPQTVPVSYHPLLPPFVLELGIPSWQFGIMVGALPLVRLFVNVPMTTAGDTMGRRPLLAAV